MKARTYTKEQLEDAVKRSRSIAQVLRILGLSQFGAGYQSIKTAVKEWNVDISHFDGKGWNRGLKFNPSPKKPLDEILVENSSWISSDKLRRRLLSEGLKEHRCEKCFLTEWIDTSIPLELDHINGIKSDNRLTNLRLLCPNCHAQTPTYRGKNIKIRQKKVFIKIPRTAKERLCVECEAIIDRRSTKCRKCYKLGNFKIDWPSKTELHKRVMNSSYEAVGRELGVTGSAIRKRLNKFGGIRE